MQIVLINKSHVGIVLKNILYAVNGIYFGIQNKINEYKIYKS